MRRWNLILFVPIFILFHGCAEDPWQAVPDFEVAEFRCPVPGGKFLEDSNFMTSWSLLGPLDPGKTPSIHTEYVPEESLLNGNRNAPRGTRWCRITVRNDDSQTLPGQVNFSDRFSRHSRSRKQNVFYACATLKCDRDYSGLTMLVSSCGLLKVWINGRSVYSCEQGTEDFKPDRANIGDLMLRKGYNRIVVKYMDDGNNAHERRNFSLRFTDAAGNLSTVR